MNAKIQGISYHFPLIELTNEILQQEFPEWSVEKISGKIGISKRYIAANDEYASDLGVAAGKKLFEELHISSQDIQFILFCTQSPDYFLPTTACLIQTRLNIPTSAGAIDINQGCSGFVYGLTLAKGILATGDIDNVLLITSETYSKFLHPEDKSNRTIFGDAAAATLITNDIGTCDIGRFCVGSDGRGGENLIVKTGGARFCRTESSLLEIDENGNAGNENYLHMNGSEIFNFTLEAVPSLIKDILTKNGLQAEEIDLFVLHQANKFMLNHLRKKMKIPEDKFYIFMENCGNTVSSTIPIALKNALFEGRIKPGDKVLIAGFGVGYSWGGTVLYY